MGTTRPTLTSTLFRCDACNWTFEAEPACVEEDASTPWHPWAYSADCTLCGASVPQQPQARHLLKMWAKASGPKTAEGKAAVTRNLAGHPTADEALRTRFNAVKHGLRSEVASYFPARPGKYAQCNGCEYLETICAQQVACLKRTELFLRHRIAFDTRDPGLLSDLRADLHANLTAIVQDMLLSILGDGVALKTPEWHFDPTGRFHLVQIANAHTGQLEQVYRIEEHPLLKRIGEFVSRFGLDLNSQGMTPKVLDDEDTIRGALAHDGENAELALEYQKRQAEALEKMQSMIVASQKKSAADPVLLEHQRAADVE